MSESYCTKNSLPHLTDETISFDDASLWGD